MKVFIYLFFLLMLLPLSSFAQSDLEDLNKYWNYRDRFLGKDGYGGFISVGPDQGQSIPASGRNMDCDCQKDWHLLNSGAPLHKGKGLVKWGDATVLHGYYLAMLSLEYANLKKAEASTIAVRKELFYALKAYERIDSLAEISLGLEGDLNGFFLRDDVPLNFYLTDTASNILRFKHPEFGGYDCVSSDFSSGTNGVDEGSYISQDQVISLLFGFAFVKKFAGDVIYVPGSQEQFGDLAMKYTHLIVKYMRDQKWRLKSPDGQKISNRWGGDARGFSTLIASAAESITEGKFDIDYDKKTFLGKLSKGSFRWAFNLHNRRNYSMIFQLMLISNQWSAESMAKRTIKSDRIMYALADAVLNDRSIHKSIKQSDFEIILHSAPNGGPCFGTTDCNAPDGWKSVDRWFHAKHKNGNPYGVNAEHSGIDYMILYNLYHFYYQDKLPTYSKKHKSRKHQNEMNPKHLNTEEKGKL